MTAQVIIKFEIEGFHKYMDAPKAVKFLRENHRHTFVITCAYNVENLNREIEIFIARAYVKGYINECFGAPAYFGNMSCEMIAKELLTWGADDGMAWVEVWEENTGGARVEI